MEFAPAMSRRISIRASVDQYSGRKALQRLEEFDHDFSREINLMTDPKLAILDEPTSGLDVQNARTVRDVIKEFSNDERSVLLSSHNMLEVEYRLRSVVRRR